MVIPTIDSELLVLSTSREYFKSFGVNLIISEVSLVKACRNKNQLTKIFHEMRLDTPLIYNNDNLSFPCFVKPYDGSSSNGTHTLIDKSMLSTLPTIAVGSATYSPNTAIVPPVIISVINEKRIILPTRP